jgi:rRNA maturation endonuclease Nob1
MLDRKEHGLPLHEKDQTGDFACYGCGAIIPAEETHCPECGQFVGKG